MSGFHTDSCGGSKADDLLPGPPDWCCSCEVDDDERRGGRGQGQSSAKPAKRDPWPSAKEREATEGGGGGSRVEPLLLPTQLAPPPTQLAPPPPPLPPLPEDEGTGGAGGLERGDRGDWRDVVDVDAKSVSISVDFGLCDE